MDIDPPAPPSSSRKKAAAKKPKFTPKPPRQRRALILPKSDSSDADSETDQELLRKVIDRLGSGLPKVEKKSSDKETPSDGPGSSKTDEPKNKLNTKNTSNLKETSKKSVTKDKNISHMLVDDKSGSSSDSENVYKEPWALDSYYPISLPMRKPGSGNPEVLNEEEFGKPEEYDETKVNSAIELGLSGTDDGEEKQIIFFQFPEKLPVGLKGKEKPGSSSSSKEDVGLKALPSGCMGKMLVYKSGVIKLQLGETIFNVSSGTPIRNYRSAVMMNTKSKKCCVLGKVDKRAVVTPDVNSILDSINLL